MNFPAQPETRRKESPLPGRREVRRRSLRDALFSGGTFGNELLTNLAGALLLVPLLVIGVTIVWIGQLISVHLFVGLLLLGPVAVKLASTGYRFLRYYAGDAAYRKKGPPELGLRLLAPLVVSSTLLVFISGLILLFEGPASRGTWVPVHKISFIVWVAVTGIHVLLHLPSMFRTLGAGRMHAERLGISSGAAGRWITIGGGLVAGLVIALLLIPQFAPWTAHGVLAHHHHHG
jgi:hypothetical protein